MKKKHLSSLRLTKRSISNLNQHFIQGAALSDGSSTDPADLSYYPNNCDSIWYEPNGDSGCTSSPLTANVYDCPDNTLLRICNSLGACPDSRWC